MKDITSNPWLWLLSCVISAFIAGIGVLNFLDDRVEKKIKDAEYLSPQVIEMPKGSILAWDPVIRDFNGVPTGKTRELPNGWKICNGKNGTPDLTNRFIMGARDASSSGNVGGTNSIAMDGEHSHGGRTNGFAGYIPGEINWDTRRGYQNPYQIKHAIRPDGSHNHGGDNRPAFYSVVYIIKM
ncbi:hypothetical protein G5Y08_004591 [Vibrio parahaemolyticus]|uniref:hypothetical protein n=1 Tax=Vibrio parahaemolyticus TaxID=670 RepID=UPI0011233AD2|nr:hypothetical protein [Vibrio parahaemolyticus]EGQ8038250.1 hypothetical protein [Vibrio parahaemolyticus]EHH2498568.1 hypothetical protein [Vibrio parahaemolyticus]EHR0875057.1 hypothetical protein [Vibrio parahaemolyticus]EID4328890.1 hypothetical protein [Vibrio parahaemolyticus]MDF4355238.1 hypothetical protein [Vibrio parahaemolyticus]